MKSIKLILVSFALALIITSATSIAGESTTAYSSSNGTYAYQGEPPASLNIASKAQMKADAIAKGRHGQMQIWGEGLLESADEVRYINVDGTDADDVKKQLSLLSFKVRTFDKTKPVYIYASIYDDSWIDLFYGSSQVGLVETPTGLVIQNMTIPLQMSRYDPNVFPNVVSARIEHVGANGERWTEWLDVVDGKILNRLEYGSTSGTLIVTSYYSSGGPTPNQTIETAYDLATGKKLPTTAINGGATVAIENHLTGSDTGLASSAAQLVLSGRMTPPVDVSQNQWQIVSPPTCTFNVTSTVRTCKMAIVVQSTIAKLGTIEAWASDQTRVAADGSIQEIAGTVSTSTSGPDVIITVTWSLDNSVGAAAGSNWHCYLKINGYEIQGPPQSPYNWGSKG